MSAENTNDLIEPASYRIAECLVNFNTNRIIKDNRKIKVEPKVMEVLALLVAADGETVTKDKLILSVWGETLVTENSLTQAISKLRKILRDVNGKNQTIETISKKGYRLIVKAEPVFQNQSTPTEKPQRTSLLKQYNRLQIAALLLLCISLGVYFSLLYLKSDSGKGSSTRTFPLTSAPGIERNPNFFDNDRFLIFCKDSLPTLSLLVIKELATGREMKLPSTVGIKRYPVVLDAQKRIVFVRKTAQSTTICQMGIDGGKTEEIVPVHLESIFGLDASFNEKWLVYPDKLVRTRPRALFRVDMSDQKLTQLTSPRQPAIGDKYPAISSDDQYIAFVREDGNRNEDIYILNVVSGEERRVTQHNSRIFGLDWSADTREILYCLSGSEDAVKLMKVTVADLSISEILSSNESVGLRPVISSNNNKVAFESWNYSTNIYRKTLSSDGKAEILVQSTWSDWSPRHSPNGKQIAFISDRSGAPRVWVLDKNSLQPRQIGELQLTYRSSPPKWTPDGKQVIIDTKINGQNRIYTLDVQSGVATERVLGGVSPNISGNGKWLYFSSHQTGTWEIWKTPFSGGLSTRVTLNGGYCASESANTNHLYFSKWTESGLWRQQLNGSEEKLVLGTLEFADRFNWLVFENGIYYIHRAKDYQPMLFFYSFSTSKSTRVATLSAEGYTRTFGLSLDPTHREVLFSQTSELGSDIMWIRYPAQ
ncbi:MAG: winged helix-turn-helix domain-containing protein [Calditrichia bacterium]